MAALSNAAEHLFSWLGLYKLTPGQFYTQLGEHPKAQRRGLFIEAFDELLSYYGY